MTLRHTWAQRGDCWMAHAGHWHLCVRRRLDNGGGWYFLATAAAGPTYNSLAQGWHYDTPDRAAVAAEMYAREHSKLGRWA